MAFAILQNAIGAAIAGDTWDGLPANNIQVADQTATTAVQTFATTVRAIRAFIWVKTVSGGAATANASNQFQLMVGDNSTLATNPRIIACYSAPLSANAFYMNGVVPDNGLVQWCKIVVQQQAGMSMTFDVSLSAT